MKIHILHNPDTTITCLDGKRVDTLKESLDFLSRIHLLVSGHNPQMEKQIGDIIDNIINFLDSLIEKDSAFVTQYLDNLVLSQYKNDEIRDIKND